MLFELNLEAYGYGLGIVMCGFIAGLVVSQVFSVIRGVSNAV
jgi:hypothetical protein